jgi:agmatinase
MNFPDYFADAESNFNTADFIIYGVPYDKTSSFRHGASQGPKDIRISSWNFETYNIKTGFDLRDVKIHDYGNLDIKNKSPINMVKNVTIFTKKILDQKKFPIALGGEHSITPGIIQAFPKSIAAVSLDAHIDFREQYENEKYNHACVIRRISNYIDIKNIAVLGIRSAEKEEYEDAKIKGLFSKDIFTIQNEGIDKIINQTINYLDNKKIYLTLDIDVIDPAYAPGTSTPEPFGLTPLDIFKCIEKFSPFIIGFDIVEVCPSYDKGQTALLAAKIVRYVIENVVTNK